MELKSFVVILLLFGIVLVSAQCPYQSPPPKVQCPSLQELANYANVSLSIDKVYNEYVALLSSAGLRMVSNQPGSGMFHEFKISNKTVDQNFHGNSMATFLELGLHNICRQYGLTPDEFMYCIKQLNVTGDHYNVCKKNDAVDCSTRNLKYQPVDGVCVNPYYPYRGAANTPYARLLKNNYADSIHEVKSSVRACKMPSSRYLINELKRLHEPYTFCQSYESIPNDLTIVYLGTVQADILKSVREQATDVNFGFQCCECNGKAKTPQRFSNRYCLPIDIPEDDAVFKGKTCMNYIRVMLGHNDCELDGAQILSAVTHFLDLSSIYTPLSVPVILSNGGRFPDQESAVTQIISTGDGRLLGFAQTYAVAYSYIRFHNVVYDELTRLYPSMANETKFYEARRFVIAVYQNIMLNEVLQQVLSTESIEKYDLNNKSPNFCPSIDPSVSAEFSQSAARYTHTFINDHLHVNLKNGTKMPVLLRFLRTTNGYQEAMGVLTGLAEHPWNTEDISHEATNFLFTKDNNPGLDLRSLDLQSERDFGVGTYCDALYYYNLTNGQCITSFDDFSPFISETNIEFLKKAYTSPCEVDLGVGGAMHHADNAWFGKIFDPMYAEQFSNLKKGDPYFYTNALSPDQVELVEYYTYKDVLCLIFSNMPPAQPKIFAAPDEHNQPEPCKSYIDLTHWKLADDPASKAPTGHPGSVPSK